MKLRVALMAGVFLGACGPAGDGRSTDAAPSGGDGGIVGGNGQDQPIKFNSGSRIKAKVTKTSISTADGAKYESSAFGGWYDAQRQEDCSPGLAGDGKTRCLPTASTMFAGYYADAACTVPGLLISVPSCLTVKYVAAPVSGCSATATTGPRIYRPGTMQATYYSKSGTTCTAQSSATLGLVPQGAEVPPTDFAEMTSTVTTQ